MSFKTNTTVVDSLISAKVGTSVQAHNANLDLLAGVTLAANKVLRVNADGTGFELVDPAAPGAVAIADVTGLEAALAGKAADDHEHLAADISDFETAVQALIEAAPAPAADTSLGTVSVVTNDATLTGASHIVIVNNAAEAATTITLDSAPANGKLVIVKDGKGDAATNNITIVGNGKNIDASGSVIINQAFESVTLVYNGTQWNII